MFTTRMAWGCSAMLAAAAMLPGIPLALAVGQTDFGAYYTRLNAGQSWEAFSRTGEYADIVVQVPKADGQLVFWRGNSYLPYWKTDKGQWDLAEIVARSGDGTKSMPDKVNAYSHVEIIENTPAALVVHWRYLSSFTAGNPHGNVSPNNFVDEVFTITPDARVKRVVKQGTDKIDEWNDPLNQTTQTLQLGADGVVEISRSAPKHSPAPGRIEGNPVKGPALVAPALWFRFDEGLGDGTKEELSGASLPVPGSKTLWKKGVSGTALVSLAKSWLQAPPLEAVADCRGAGYEAGQRAYVMCASGQAPSFRITASVEHPISNLCVLVKNWNCGDAARLEIDSKLRSAGPAFRQGIVRDQNGRHALVVWLQMQATEPVAFTLRGAKPVLVDGSPQALAWAAVPQSVTNTFDVTMAATALPGNGNEYSFERVGSGGRGTGWQSESVYTDPGLMPDTEYAYRVKARDAYSIETAWSPVVRVKTPAAPPPVIWSLDEGGGKTIKDSAGRHEGTIQGDASWVPGVAGKALHLDGKSYVQLNPAEDLRSNGSFTWAAWMRTEQGGTIVARSGAGREWQQGGKVMFVQNGRLRFDACSVGVIGAETPVADGKWHHVAVAVSALADGDNIRCYVDGRPAGSGRLDVAQYDEQGLPVRIGFCNENFPQGQSGLVGDLDEVQWFGYVLSPEAVSRIFGNRELPAGSVPSAAAMPRQSPHSSRACARNWTVPTSPIWAAGSRLTSSP